MGIRGLSAFVENNSSLQADHKLHDTRVIIDGNNLYHHLYYDAGVPHLFGGNYNQFSKKAIRYFNVFKLCNISPYVVFDGGYEPDDRKFPVVLQRGKDRLGSACNRHKIMPLLAFETFKRVLKEQKIQYVTTCNEADDQMAILANQWNCPVMSNDSDFYIFDIDGGVIPLSSVNLTLCAHDSATGDAFVRKIKDKLTDTQVNYIPVKMYKATNLESCYRGFEVSKLPLLGTLLGNDIVDSKYLQNFHAALPDHKVSKRQTQTKYHSRITSLIHWLKTVKDVDAGVETALHRLPKNCQHFVGPLMQLSVKSYTRTQAYANFDLRKYFEGQIDSCEEAETRELLDFHRNALPGWFEMGIRECEIYNQMQNVAVLHRVILQCQMEDMSQPSAYVCSRFLRQVTYSIILQNGDCFPLPDADETPTRQTHVVEFDRDRKLLKKIFLEPLDEIPGHGSLPYLSDVPEMEERARKSIVIAALLQDGSLDSAEEEFDQSELFMVLILSFWLRNATPKVLANHLRTMILCQMMLQFTRWKWLQDTNQVNSAFYEELTTNMRSTFDTLPHNDRSTTLTAFERFLGKVILNSRNPFDRSINHGFCQFQACMFDALTLNQALMCPFPCQHPGLVFDGSFCYNLCQELNKRAAPGLFVVELLGKTSPLLELFNKFESVIVRLAGEGCLADTITAALTPRRKKKKGAMEMNQTEVTDKTGSDSDNKSDESDGVQSEFSLEKVASCSITNRFALLKM